MHEIYYELVVILQLQKNLYILKVYVIINLRNIVLTFRNIFILL